VHFEPLRGKNKKFRVFVFQNQTDQLQANTAQRKKNKPNTVSLNSLNQK
jgi:hypothetical protein